MIAFGRSLQLDKILPPEFDEQHIVPLFARGRRPAKQLRVPDTIPYRASLREEMHYLGSVRRSKRREWRRVRRDRALDGLIYRRIADHAAARRYPPSDVVQC